MTDIDFRTRTFNCGDCPNNCSIVECSIVENNEVIARWGSRCGKWEVF